MIWAGDLGSLAWLAKNKLGKFVYFGKKREWDRAMACSIERSQNDVLAGNIEKGEVGHWFWPSWIVCTDQVCLRQKVMSKRIGTVWSQWRPCITGVVLGSILSLDRLERHRKWKYDLYEWAGFC